MQNLIDQYRRYPSVENAKRLREYFERNPAESGSYETSFCVY